jgi:hypothetical protein
MNKKLIVGLLTGLFIVSLAVGLSVNSAFADNNKNEKGKDNGLHLGNILGKISDDDAEKVGLGLSVDTKESAVLKSDGSFRITGVKVNSVSSSNNVLNISFFGFSRDINVSGAKIIGAGQMVTIGDIQPGDILTGSGKFDRNTHIITVDEIRDVSFVRVVQTNMLQQRIDDLLNLVKKLQDQLNTWRSR